MARYKKQRKCKPKPKNAARGKQQVRKKKVVNRPQIRKPRRKQNEYENTEEIAPIKKRGRPKIQEKVRPKKRKIPRKAAPAAKRKRKQPMVVAPAAKRKRKQPMVAAPAAKRKRKQPMAAAPAAKRKRKQPMVADPAAKRKRKQPIVTKTEKVKRNNIKADPRLPAQAVKRKRENSIEAQALAGKRVKKACKLPSPLKPAKKRGRPRKNISTCTKNKRQRCSVPVAPIDVLQNEYLEGEEPNAIGEDANAIGEEERKSKTDLPMKCEVEEGNASQSVTSAKTSKEELKHDGEQTADMATDKQTDNGEENPEPLINDDPNQVYMVQEKLARILGLAAATREIMKDRALIYILKLNLKDPEDPQYVIADKFLERAFGVKRFLEADVEKFIDMNIEERINFEVPSPPASRSFNAKTLLMEAEYEC